MKEGLLDVFRPFALRQKRRTVSVGGRQVVLRQPNLPDRPGGYHFQGLLVVKDGLLDVFRPFALPGPVGKSGVRSAS